MKSSLGALLSLIAAMGLSSTASAADFEARSYQLPGTCFTLPGMSGDDPVPRPVRNVHHRIAAERTGTTKATTRARKRKSKSSGRSRSDDTN